MILMPGCRCCGSTPVDVIQFFGIPDEPWMIATSVIGNYNLTTPGYFSIGDVMNCVEDVDDDNNPILIGQGFQVDRENADLNIGTGYVFYRWVDGDRLAGSNGYVPFSINLYDGDPDKPLELTVIFRANPDAGSRWIEIRLIYPDPPGGGVGSWPKDVLLVEGVDFTVEATDYRTDVNGVDISSMFSGVKVYIHSGGHYDSTVNGDAAVTCPRQTGKMSPATASPRDNYCAVTTPYDYQRTKYSTIYDPTTYMETWTFDDELLLTFDAGTATRRTWWWEQVDGVWERNYSDWPIELPDSVVLKYCPAVPTRTIASDYDETTIPGPGWVAQFDILDPNGTHDGEGGSSPGTINHTMVIMPPSLMPITHPDWWNAENLSTTPDSTPSAVFWWTMDPLNYASGAKFTVSGWPPRFGNFPTSTAPAGVMNPYPNTDGSEFDKRVHYLGFTLEQA